MNNTEKRIKDAIDFNQFHLDEAAYSYRETVKVFRNCFEEDSNAERDYLMDHDPDWGYDLVHGHKNKYVQCLTINTDDEAPHKEFIPAWAEYDEVYIQLNYKDSAGIRKRLISDMELAHLIFGIFCVFDCTGCCNAIEYIKFGHFNILMKINSSRTYHS